MKSINIDVCVMGYGALGSGGAITAIRQINSAAIAEKNSVPGGVNIWGNVFQ